MNKDTYNKPKAHAHISFSDHTGYAFGGHLVRAKIAIVGEVIVDVLTTDRARLGAKNWEVQDFGLKRN